MGARAASARRTAERILDATVEQFTLRPYDEVSLQDVADSAGVTVQTVLRRFGSKGQLVAAASARALAQVRAERANAPSGDLDAALDNLAAHYEAWGDRVLRLLAQEDRVPEVRAVTEQGRRLHEEWARRVFGTLGPEIRLEALLAATDVLVWKVLRRDRGLDAASYRRALDHLVKG